MPHVRAAVSAGARAHPRHVRGMGPQAKRSGRDGAKRKASGGEQPSLGGIINPICRLALFQIVLGSTPRRRPCKACPSQNDDFLPRFGIHPLYTALQGTSIPKRFGTTLFRLLCGTSRSYFSASGGVCGVLRACFDLIPQPEWRVLLSRTCISMLLRLFKIVW